MGIYSLVDYISIVLKIWVYGNSYKSKLVAVVIPHEENAKKWAYSNGHVGSFSELCSLDQLKSYVLAELKFTAERNKVLVSVSNKLTHVYVLVLPHIS